MKFLPTTLLALVALCAAAAPATPATGPAWTVGSKWRFTITDHGAKPVAFVVFRVTAEKANSCLGGDWLRLKRVEGYYDNLSEPAWMLRGQTLTVLLASDACDRYDGLEGALQGRSFSGAHSLFGIEGSDELGTATAVRVD